MTKRGFFIGVIVLILALLPIMNSAAATIVVRARGVAGSEQIRVEIGGSTVQTFTLSISLNNYTATTNKTGAININFINDGSNKDAFIDYIDVNGERRQAENQGTNTGVYQNYKCGGSYSEWLHCNGYIAFGNTGSGTTTTSSGGAPTPTPVYTQIPTPSPVITPTPPVTPTPGTTTTTTSVVSGQGHGWLSAGQVYTTTIPTSTTSVTGSPPSTSTTTTSIVGSTGNVYLAVGRSFIVVIHANTGTTMARSFGFTITYPVNLVMYKSAEEIVPGCNLSVDSGTPGTLKITGFNASGIKGSPDLMLVRLTCQAIDRGNGNISLDVDTLTDLSGNTIGTLSGTGITFTMEWVTSSVGGGSSTTTTSVAGSSTTIMIGM